MKTLTISKGIKIPVPAGIEIKPFFRVESPPYIIVPLKQHEGSECVPLVKKGKTVKKGEIIGRNSTTCVHSSIAGKVKEIRKKFVTINGEKTQAVVIEPSGEVSDEVLFSNASNTLSMILEGGVVDFSSTSPSLLQKIEDAQKRRARFFIINGLEEFFVFGSKASLLKEHKEYIKEGINVVKRFFSFEKTFLLVYKHTLDQLDVDDFEGVVIVPTEPKHPIYKEKLILNSLFLSSKDKCFILDLETVYSLGRLIKDKVGCIERAITVSTTDLKEVRSILVPLGTPISWILEKLGFELEEIAKVVVNGPLSGKAIPYLDYPITKQINQILVLKQDEVFNYSSRVCVKCGLCVDVCPMNLIPFMIAGYSESRSFELAKKSNILMCIECASCTFVCPVKIPLIQWIQLGKNEILKAM